MAASEHEGNGRHDLRRRDDYSRRFFLDVMATGQVFIRERGAPITEGALPAFSVDTYDEAEALRVRFCRLARDGSGVYTVTDWPEDASLDDVYALADRFRAVWGNAARSAS